MQVVRCWPADAQFDCVILEKNSGGTTWLAERQTTTALAPLDLLSTGYGCSVDANQPFGIHFQESISRTPNQELLTNMQVYREPVKEGWTREYIERFMRENNVPRLDSWLSCAGVRELLLAGRGVTLTTTAVEKSSLIPAKA